MKYGIMSTWKGRRRFGRHGSGGHKPNKPGSSKGSIGGAPKPSTQRYFAERRWITNKERKIRLMKTGGCSPQSPAPQPEHPRARRTAKATAALGSPPPSAVAFAGSGEA